MKHEKVTKTFDDNTSWIEGKIKQASEEGNFTDWENYTNLLEQWRSRNED